MPFRVFSEGFPHANVICGPSVNLEFTIQGSLPKGNFKPGAKNLVAGINHFFVRGIGCRFSVDLFDGSQIEILAEDSPMESHSGSSVNMAMAMKFWEQSVGVFAPIGPGAGGNTIRLSLEQAGIHRALFNGMRSTPRTLTVRQSSGGSTLFMVKPPYDFSPQVLDSLTIGKDPFVLVATGVKPQDLSLIVPLFTKKRGHFRVLTPSKDLIFRSDMRRELFWLTGNTDLLQVNEEEALALIGKTGEFIAEDILRLQSVTTAAMVVVTLSERGALMYDSTDRNIFSSTGCTQVVDSSGAGDAHLSALVWGMFLYDWPLDCERALRLAAFVAERKCLSVGSWSGLPTLSELEEFLRRNN